MKLLTPFKSPKNRSPKNRSLKKTSRFLFFATITLLSLPTKPLLANNQSLSINDNWLTEPATEFRKINNVVAKKYLIVTANELASKAGAEIISKGGTAIDAVIAAQMVLNLVEPQSSGIGGGTFLLHYDKKTNSTIYFNGRETAPEKAEEKMLLDKNGNARPFLEVVQGGLSVATPGLLKALEEAHKKFGKLPWNQLFEPAIKLAKNGFPMNQRLKKLSSHISYLKSFPETNKLYLKENGEEYQIGEIIKNPKFAKTLETIAKDGSKAFYEGKIAKKIVKTVTESPINAGLLSENDLKNYQIKIGNLICSYYRQKYKICSMPMPSSGGITLLQILGILENFNLNKMQPNSPQTIHLILEASKLAYADRNKYIGDVENVPIAEMLDKKYLKQRASLISQNQAIKEPQFGVFNNKNQNHKIVNNNEPPSTTHISIIDPEGNAVSLTSSIEYYFGSALSVEGFLLNNQMTDFSAIPEIDGVKVANRIQPNKQPRSSMSPTFVFDDKNNLIMVIGSPGGPRIIQFILKAILNFLDFNLDIQKSIDFGNFIALNNIIELEENTEIVKIKPELEKLGHKVKITEITSGLNGITLYQNIADYHKNKLSSSLYGGADPRRESFAIGE
ncbi:MAG: gamma-glutamyltransferase [Rickettsiales bacterium]|nr:gamma-glutamyltransferase [Rickettsiales bacterium]